jgi:hypothetical protein
MKTNQLKLILKDTRSGQFYNKERGGFSEPEAAKATTIEGEAVAAFVKAHFTKPEFIEGIPVFATESEAFKSMLEAEEMMMMDTLRHIACGNILIIPEAFKSNY